MSLRPATARAAVAVVLAGAVLGSSPASAAAPSATKYATAIVTKVNDVRADHALVRLKRSTCLQRFARKQAKAIAEAGTLFHQRLGKIQKACKVGWVGENVAFSPGTPEQMVELWMGSPLHRANILFKKFRTTGVGVVKADGYWWASQVFAGK